MTTDNATELRAGQIVCLKSGGPLMTVERVDRDLVRCAWFDEEGRQGNASFRRAMVRVQRPALGEVMA